jgi:uncharacterized protein
VAKAFALHIQNPKVPKQRFDLIAAPLHGGYTGKNVINTFGAVHSVTPKRLAEAARDRGGSLLVTPSRRTSSEALRALVAPIGSVPNFVWDGTGESPYYAFLATADAIVTTEDSVNMVTEAAGTGKPLYVQRLKGSSTRLGRFHVLMRERGATRPLPGRSNRGPTPRSKAPSSLPAPSAARLALKPVRKVGHDGPRVAKHGH